MTKLKQTDMNDTYKDDEIDLKGLFNALWASKKLIISITSVFGLCSIFIVLTITPNYQAEALLSIAEDSQRSAAAPSRGGLSTLAAVAGISLPSAGVTDRGALVEATIKSRSFLKHLMTFEDILPSLMAAKDFDVDKQILIFDDKVYNAQSKTWVRQAKPPYQAAPSVLETYEVYRDTLIVLYSDRNGFISLTFRHISPIFAKEFLDLIVNEINELMRKKDLEESTNALEFLKSEMANTSYVEIKNSINQLIQSQLDTQMRAKIREDYVLWVIDSPFAPEEKISPQSMLICIFTTMIGGFLAVLWVLFSHYGSTFIDSKDQSIVSE